MFFLAFVLLSLVVCLYKSSFFCCLFVFFCLYNSWTKPVRFLFFLLFGNIKSLNIIAAMPFVWKFFLWFLHFCLLYRKIKNKNAHDDSVCSCFSQYNIFTSLVISLYSHVSSVFVCIFVFECFWSCFKAAPSSYSLHLLGCCYNSTASLWLFLIFFIFVREFLTHAYSAWQLFL